MSTNTVDRIMELHANPLMIQQDILSDIENSLANGKTIISPNNVATFLVETFSSISAGIVGDMITALDEVFPQRAISTESLYKHMSDYDYIGLFATPSSTFIDFSIPIDTLEKAPEDESGKYNIIKIPRDSVFYVGRYKFSLHYPIIIQYSKASGAIVVKYDTTFKNNIYTVANHLLENRIFTINGIKIVSIKIPIHQFERIFHSEELFKEVPFSKTYSYTSQFYAIRVYTNREYDDTDSPTIIDENGDIWTEIKSSLSKDIYNPDDLSVPTMLLDINNDDKTIRITLPYIFISNNLVGTRLKIEILTTDGYVDIDTTGIIEDLVQAKFPLVGNVEYDKYTSLITTASNVNIYLISTRIYGGSLGIGFDDLRERVVSNISTGGLLITPLDVEGYFNDVGLSFVVTKFKDGITSRIYLCHKELRDRQSNIISSGTIDTFIDSKDIDTFAGVVKYLDGSYTLKPNVVYKYDKEKNACLPINKFQEFGQFGESGDWTEYLNRLNNNIYTFNPFYTRVGIIKNIPFSYSYDLESVSINNIEFIDASTSTSIGLSIYNATIIKEENRYKIVVQVKYSGSNIELNDIKISIAYKSSGSLYMFKISDISNMRVVSEDINEYVVYLNTDYFISSSDDINMLFDNGNYKIPLESDLEVGCFIKNTHASTSAKLNTIKTVIPEYVPISEYRIEAIFGVKIEELFNGVNIISTEKVYRKYEEIIYETHTSDIYEINEDGSYVYNETTGELTKIHNSGDYVYYPESITYDVPSEDFEDHIGEIVIFDDSTQNFLLTDVSELSEYSFANFAPRIIKHNIGDIILDIDGEQIEEERYVTYRVMMSHINYRVLEASNIDSISYIRYVRNLILSNCSSISTITDRMIPTTKIYYRPSKSIGYAKFKNSYGRIEEFPLEIGLKFKIFVNVRALDSETQNTIMDTIIKIVDDHTTGHIFSSADVVDEILLKLGDIITSIDINGINDEIENQTLIHAEDGTILNLRHKLIKTENNTIESVRDIEFEFISSIVDN